MTQSQTSTRTPSRRAQCIEAAQRLILLGFTALSFVHSRTGLAQDSVVPFTSSGHQFSFTHSPELVEEKIDVPQALVALRSPPGGFPSFNVLVSAETYDPTALSEASYRDKIINDYRAVGIADAHGVRTYSSPVAGQNVYTTEIRYQFKGQLLITAVTLLPVSSGKHFILTYMDLADQFYRRKVMREEIINSFKLLEHNAGAAENPEDSAKEPGLSSLNYWGIGVFLLGAALAVGSIVLKRRASSGTP